MYKNKLIIEDFINHRCSLVDFISIINEYKQNELKAVLECLLLFYQETYSDEQMIVYLLLGIVKKLDLSNIDNMYTQIIKSFEINSNEKVNIIINEDELFMATVDSTILIINNSNVDKTVELPYGFKNRKITCLNCNDVFSVNNTFDVYCKSFYVLR